MELSKEELYEYCKKQAYLLDLIARKCIYLLPTAYEELSEPYKLIRELLYQPEKLSLEDYYDLSVDTCESINIIKKEIPNLIDQNLKRDLTIELISNVQDKNILIDENILINLAQTLEGNTFEDIKNNVMYSLFLQLAFEQNILEKLGFYDQSYDYKILLYEYEQNDFDENLLEEIERYHEQKLKEYSEKYNFSSSQYWLDSYGELLDIWERNKSENKIRKLITEFNHGKRSSNFRVGIQSGDEDIKYALKNIWWYMVQYKNMNELKDIEQFLEFYLSNEKINGDKSSQINKTIQKYNRQIKFFLR